MSFSQPWTPWVLLVEDNTDDERLAIRAFRNTGVPVEIVVARDAVCAQQMLGITKDGGSAQIFRPDLIVCDLKMPKLSGDDLVESVRKNDRLSKIPCVIFSSSDEAGDVAHCLAKGASAYVVKPVEYDIYLEEIARIVDTFLVDGNRTRPVKAAVMAKSA